MCGRYGLAGTVAEVEAAFGCTAEAGFPPRYNIAPTQPIAVVVAHRDGRRLELMRWGLVPAWVRDPAAFSLLFNARIESVAEKPAFRGALRYRRCLVPASGFYEWRRGGAGGGRPFWISRPDGGLIAFAGLYETWSGPDGNEIDTACIVTTAADATLAAIHPRMPVIVPPSEFDTWLGAPPPASAAIDAVTRPAGGAGLVPVMVSDRVGSVANDGPDLIRPVPADEAGAPAGEDQLRLL